MFDTTEFRHETPLYGVLFLFSIHFTITGLQNIVHSTEDFVIKRFVESIEVLLYYDNNKIEFFSCSFDEVVIKNGQDALYTISGRKSGTYATVFGDAKEVTITFTSDPLITDTGFEATYQVTQGKYQMVSDRAALQDEMDITPVSGCDNGR